MKTTRILYPLFLLLVLISACSKDEDYNLTETVFIEDPYYPGLPIYSEWGYNTFGAYIDRKPFVSTNADLPAKIFVNTDTMHLIIRGKMEGQNTDIKFSFKGYSFATYFDVVGLDSVTINLKDPNCAVTLKIGNDTKVLKLIEGEIFFKRVQQLYIDEEPTRAIMSGYFKLKTFLNDEPIAISYGRFDLGIGYENFYNFKK